MRELQPTPEAPRATAPPPRAALHARVDPGSRADAVRHLLAARSQAVLRRDRTAFLATVDPQERAFGSRQAALFEALQGVTFSSWTYTVDPAHEQGADAQLDAAHGTWWAPDVVLHYALRGFDRTPTAQPQALTFVQRAGRWFVGADDDFAPLGRTTTRDLWDGGPVTARQGARCLVLSHPGSGLLARQVAAECEAAVPRVTNVWGPGWAQRVVVLVPHSPVELARLVPDAGDLSQIAAVATAELVGPAAGYHPVGDRILVNPATFSQLGRLGRRVVLTHEVTHVASRAATGPQVPTWLVEGLADYVGYLGAGVPVGVAAEELRSDLRIGQLPRTLPTDEAFDGANERLPQIYEQSWLAVRLLVSRYGEKGLLALYRATGADGRAGSFPRALAAVGHTTVAELTAAWRATLTQQLG